MRELHRQHRKRHKERFLELCGADFQTHELVELLLFYAIPRKNTNSIAHELCERFGTIEKMAEASIDELKLVRGVGDNSAILIKLILSFAQKYIDEKNKEPKRIETLEKAVAYGKNITFGAIKEVVYATFTDNSLNVIDTSLVAIGTIDEAKPLIRNIIELCILKRASALVLFHNHPHGGTEASEADINFTSLLERELDLIGINLVEHIVIDNSGFNTILRDIRAVRGIESHINIEKFYEKQMIDNRKEENK
jgi:DNA repair protein RadC